MGGVAEAEACVLDSDGRTALEWAERKGHSLVAHALHRHEQLHRLVTDSAVASNAEMCLWMQWDVSGIRL